METTSLAKGHQRTVVQNSVLYFRVQTPSLALPNQDSEVLWKDLDILLCLPGNWQGRNLCEEYFNKHKYQKDPSKPEKKKKN